ncbi:hypothetical protein HU200_035633 [Digitaria exilis]|uniref:Auxin-responsive protein n=1 Tax=Digitaria exilis TaxID=1010633 RepID=A0A835BGA4_9POAL|nr:hypothetical protein HU200_035633 [Digitaria exilis]
MELELGLAPPNARPPAGGGGELFPGLLGGKRAFGEAFVKATLPLFVRDGDGGGGDDDDGGRHGVDPETTSNKKRLVGWLPVKSVHRRSSGGAYVKVKMEGVAIGRKVDVSLHGSYDELLRTLARMFPSGGAGGAEDEAAVTGQHEGRRRGPPYVVTYEDGEGDWLLVGDVPWE